MRSSEQRSGARAVSVGRGRHRRLHAGVGQREQWRQRLALDQAADHGAGRVAVDVADHGAELDAAIVKHLVQPVEFAGARRRELVRSTPSPHAAFGARRCRPRLLARLAIQGLP